MGGRSYKGRAGTEIGKREEIVWDGRNYEERECGGRGGGVKDVHLEREGLKGVRLERVQNSMGHKARREG